MGWGLQASPPWRPGEGFTATVSGPFGGSDHRPGRQDFQVGARGHVGPNIPAVDGDHHDGRPSPVARWRCRLTAGLDGRWSLVAQRRVADSLLAVRERRGRRYRAMSRPWGAFHGITCRNRSVRPWCGSRSTVRRGYRAGRFAMSAGWVASAIRAARRWVWSSHCWVFFNHLQK